MAFVCGAWQLFICYQPVNVNMHTRVCEGNPLTVYSTVYFKLKDLLQVIAGVMGESD